MGAAVQSVAPAGEGNTNARSPAGVQSVHGGKGGVPEPPGPGSGDPQATIKKGKRNAEKRRRGIEGPPRGIVAEVGAAGEAVVHGYTCAPARDMWRALEAMVRMPEPDVSVEEESDDDFPWDVLLDAIRQNEVIPVVGRDLSAWVEGDVVRTFDEKVAAELVVRLDKRLRGFRDIIAGRASAQPLHTEEVALRFRLARGEPTELYEAFVEALKAATSKEKRPPPEPLAELAQIEPLSFFLTVTFDDFLEQALRDKRPGKTLRVGSSVRAGELGGQPSQGDVLVHHLFGYRSGFEVFDGDRIRAVLDLEKKLENELADLGKQIRGRTLLFLGCGLPEWLMRFFVLALLDATGDEGRRRPAQIADAGVLQASALAIFLRSMKNVTLYEGGDARRFVKKLVTLWRAQSTKSVPAPRAGARVVLSCHEADFPLVEPELARLRAWQVDAAVVRSAQDLESVLRVVEFCSFYVACLSSHSIATSAEEQERLWSEWKFAKSRREASGRSFSMYYSAIADEKRVADEVGKEAHPLWGFSKRAGQDLALQLVDPLRKAGHLVLRGRAGEKGADQALVVYCIHGEKDWDEGESSSGVDDLIGYLERTFRSTPWIRLTHDRDQLGGTDMTKVLDEVDALLLFASPAVDVEKLDGIRARVEATSSGRKLPLYRVPFRRIEPGESILAFKPLDLGDIDVIRSADQAAQDDAWAAVARALRLAILDDYLIDPARSAR